MMVAIFAFAGQAYATCDGECSDNGYYQGAFGGYKIKARSIGGGVDGDIDGIHDGFAGGISGAGGLAVSKSKGLVINGYTKGSVSTIAGGLTNTEAWAKQYEFQNGVGMGVGSKSVNQAVTGGKFETSTGTFMGLGGSKAKMFGVAGQGSANISLIGDDYLEAEGFTGGVAGQGSIGGFYGSGKTGALIYGAGHSQAGAFIDMKGYSYSNSFKEITEVDGVKTESMKTQVGAGTDIMTYGYNYNSSCGIACSRSNVQGGYIAVGGAASHTKLDGADAKAAGIYAGAGSLNSNYKGSANGYTYGDVTTVDGMNGQIVQSGAGMSVTSFQSSGQVD